MQRDAITVQSWDIVVLNGLEESKPFLGRVIVAVSSNAVCHRLKQFHIIFILFGLFPHFSTYRVIPRIQ